LNISFSIRALDEQNQLLYTTGDMAFGFELTVFIKKSIQQILKAASII
jgi:hypothetical protein